MPENLPRPELALVSFDDADRLFRARRESLLTVDQPLVLISQVQRSGGTLLSALFDGHPELLAHPWELLIGHPQKYDWPDLDPAGTAEEWAMQLEQPWIEPTTHTGYLKSRERRSFPPGLPPALIPPSFVTRLFLVLCADDPPGSPREILDRYFTAFFGAWLDLQGIHEAPKRWVTGFCPRLAWGESRQAFWSAYPDGRLIVILRDPRGWYASARDHTARWAGGPPETALETWLEGVDELVAAKSDRPDDVLVVTYERLVSNPRDSLAAIADWLGMSWDERLMTATFNRREVEPESSFGLRGAEISATPAERWQDVLSAEEIQTVEALALERDAAARELADIA